MCARSTMTWAGPNHGWMNEFDVQRDLCLKDSILRSRASRRKTPLHKNMSHRTHSNGLTAENLVVVVDTTETASDEVADTLAEWLVKHINQAFPVASGSYPHYLVAGSQHCDHVDDKTGETLNRIVAVAHESSGSGHMGMFFNSITAHDGLIVTREQQRCTPTLSAETIASRLAADTPPVRVNAIGVSGVSNEYASEVWGEVISTERNWMDSAGRGYMVHPMWIHDDRNGTVTVREMSYNFGWGPAYTSQFV